MPAYNSQTGPLLRHSVRRAPTSRGRDLRARVPERARLAERRLPADEHADGPRRRAGRVLGLRADQLAADASVPDGVARALPRGGAARDRRAHAGLLVRPRARHRRGRGGAARDPVRRGARPGLRGLAPVREQGLAGPLPLRPDREAGAAALRRGRVRGHRARDRGVPRDRRGADGAGAPRGRSRRPARAADGRHRAARPTASGSSWCATGPTARTGSPPPTPARPRASATARGAAYAALSEGGVEPGLYEVDGTVEAESPGLRLHGVQFTPGPPAPS